MLLEPPYHAVVTPCCLSAFPGGSGVYGPAGNPGYQFTGVSYFPYGNSVYATLQSIDCPRPTTPCASISNYGGIDAEAYLLANALQTVSNDVYQIEGLVAPYSWPPG